MAWYKIGNTIYSEEEMHARSNEFMDIAVPSAFTAIGVYLLVCTMGVLPYFVVHATTAKLIYVVVGFFLFIIGYRYRKLIVTLVALALLGMFLWTAGGAFRNWLMA